MVAYKHNEIENFGAAEDEDETTLLAIIRQARLSGFLVKEVETYGVLKLSPEGKKFLKKPHKFEVKIEVHDEDEGDGIEGPIAACAAADDVLFSILKDVRKKAE